ncbi:unnamed protein product [Heterosigma akashiwo]
MTTTIFTSSARVEWAKNSVKTNKKHHPGKNKEICRRRNKKKQQTSPALLLPRKVPQSHLQKSSKPKSAWQDRLRRARIWALPQDSRQPLLAPPQPLLWTARSI